MRKTSHEAAKPRRKMKKTSRRDAEPQRKNNGKEYLPY
jgi:hypothetical protein